MQRSVFVRLQAPQGEPAAQRALVAPCRGWEEEVPGGRRPNSDDVSERGLLTAVYTWVFQLFGETLEKVLPSLVKQAFDIRRRVRAVGAREERQHGHTWLV